MPGIFRCSAVRMRGSRWGSSGSRQTEIWDRAHGGVGGPWSGERTTIPATRVTIGQLKTVSQGPTLAPFFPHSLVLSAHGKASGVFFDLGDPDFSRISSWLLARLTTTSYPSLSSSR